MKLTRVQNLMTKRLAWLTVKTVGAPIGSALAAERDALHTLLRCQGMLDAERLAQEIAKVEGHVLPIERRTVARARRGDELLGLVVGLVDGARSAARVA